MGEVATIQQADQFIPGHTAYACGFFAVAECCSMAPPGKPPTKNAAWITANALTWYAQFDGNNGAGNMSGMSLAQLYALLGQVGLHYQAIAMNASAIRGWLAAGYPVIVAVAETAVHDIELGRNPYPWTPSGSHVIVLTGLDGSNFLVRDSANIAPPNSLRPGPRRYDATILVSGLVSATVAVPPWKPRPASANPPTPTQEKPMSKIPDGWKDTGSELIAPNGIKVIRGFRDHVLNYPNGWSSSDWPLEAEQGLSVVELALHSGEGTRQIFRTKMLVWYAARGVLEAWVGAELLAWINKAQTTPPPVTVAMPADLRNQLATLQQQLSPLVTVVDTIGTVLKNN